MAVLKTTSPTARPSAPIESPRNTVPSASARMAGLNDKACNSGSIVADATSGRSFSSRSKLSRHYIGVRARDQKRLWSVPARPSRQAEHVAHVEQPRRFGTEKASGAQCAHGEGGTTARLVSDLQALASPGEQSGMVADDVTAAHRRKADGGVLALPGDAFATVHCDLAKIAAERLGNDLTHSQCRSRGCIDLMAVMGLDDLDVVPFAKHLRGLLQQFEHQRHAHAQVGREHDGNITRGLCDLAFVP